MDPSEKQRGSLKRVRVAAMVLAVVLILLIVVGAAFTLANKPARIRFVNQGWLTYDSGQFRSIDAETFRVETGRFRKFGPIVIESGVSGKDVHVP